MHRSQSPALTACAAAALAGGLLASPAVAQEAPAPNHRGVPNGACGADTPQAGFSDRAAVPEAHRRSVDCVAALGVATGRDGAYHPGQPVTRGQMASFVARALEAAGHALPAPQEQGFQDVEGSVHRDRIRQLAEAGIVHGRTQDRYEPEGTVTRGQMAAYVIRAAEFAHDAEYRPVGDDDYFLDIDGSTHRQDIRTGYELHLFAGTAPGEYSPQDPVRRDAMATFLTRALDLVWSGERQSSHQDYLVDPQETLTASAGDTVSFDVLQRYSTEADGLQQSVHLALFPCGQVATQDLPPVFTDADGDGTADARGATDTMVAEIAAVNGEAQPAGTRFVAGVQPQDGTVTFTLGAAAPDCTVPVVWDDRPPVDELRVDATGLAAHPYGIGKVTWEAAP